VTRAVRLGEEDLEVIFHRHCSTPLFTIPGVLSAVVPMLSITGRPHGGQSGARRGHHADRYPLGRPRVSFAACSPEGPMMSTNSFNSRDELTVGERTYEIHRLDRIPGSQRLPYSLKVLLENLLRNEDGRLEILQSAVLIAQEILQQHLENLLRNEDGRLVTAEQIAHLRDWSPNDVGEHEIQYTPARVLMQDFTGVPCVVDLVAMRDAITDLGGDPKKINPLIPAELVIDHSVIA